ncbi:MAG: amino acid permease [Myxococcaceae bacterium]|nr:amino acid permease [Myxococcaceae bacterium]MCI0674070.1 amino acid permease [Myxococcaceae bacterium]
MRLLATKSIDLLREQAESETGLRRTLTASNLVALGIGAIVGAGIFVITGWAAARYAGPAVPLSFVLGAFACAFAGLCYAELASTVPVAGSAYTYAYATMGELAAWIIGWDLVLEYTMAGASVSVGWSGYFSALLSDFGHPLPESLASAPFRWCEASDVAARTAGCSTTGLHATGAMLNLPAVAIIGAMTLVLVLGVRESAWVNNVIVVLKLAVLLAFIGFGIAWVRPENWQPFIPPNEGHFGAYGVSGILRGAGLVFFAYIGFDAVSTAAQEAKRPQRDLPIGILGSLGVCTVLYVVVSVVLTGLVPYRQLDVPHPVGFAVGAVPQLRWMAPFVDLGAVLGLASVVLVMLLGQARVFYSMSRDGLLPEWLSRVHPRLRTPWMTQLAVGAFASLFGGMFPIDLLGQLVNIGTLLAFVLVCGGILVLRRTRPELERPFRTPFVPVVPLLGIASCVGLMATLPLDTWLRLFVWLAFGLCIYLAYGRRHSTLRTGEDARRLEAARARS